MLFENSQEDKRVSVVHIRDEIVLEIIHDKKLPAVFNIHFPE